MARGASTKSGIPRKSPRARLPIATTRGEDRFEPTEADWARMEAAFGFVLEESDRAEIAKLATGLLLFAPFERTAPFADDAVKWLVKLRRAAGSFRRGLLAGQQLPTEIERQAAFHAGILIEQRLEELRYTPTRSMDDMVRSMTAFTASIELALKELRGSKSIGLVEGAAWDGMVTGLTRWFKSQGRPTGASKGSDKSKRNEPSPFVALVRELQRTFPPEYRRHTASDAALAKGIGDARRKRKKRDVQSPGQ